MNRSRRQESTGYLTDINNATASAIIDQHQRDGSQRKLRLEVRATRSIVHSRKNVSRAERYRPTHNNLMCISRFDY